MEILKSRKEIFHVSIQSLSKYNKKLYFMYFILIKIKRSPKKEIP